MNLILQLIRQGGVCYFYSSNSNLTEKGRDEKKLATEGELKKQTNSPFLISLQDLRVGECGGRQQFPLWTDEGPSARVMEQKLI